MTAEANAFRDGLRSARTQIGLWVGLASGYSIEICADAGFDWLLIDGEHAPNDVRTILHQLQAAAPYPPHCIVRPPIGQTHLIKQMLDIGARTLLIPMVETAEQAADLVAAMQYPPRGVRGVGSGLARAAGWGQRPDYLHDCGDAMCLLVQIESRRGLDNLDAIAAVPGVDGVFIGPSDLAASLGHLGRTNDPEVQVAIEDAIRRIHASGKAAGILATDPNVARRYIELGCRFVAVGLDTALLAKAARSLAQSFNPS
ncbi:MAG TPA: 4-hydroxy-2-oxoheptanedioate aldolase [Acidiphilium sp.]